MNLIEEYKKVKDWLPLLKEFAELYEKRPIKNNHGGGHSPHYFWLWWAIKTLKPTTVIESGVWYGQSTWLIEQTMKKPYIFCIDPEQDRIQYKSKHAQYHTNDFSTCSWNGNIENALVFFDDHVNHHERIQQAKDFGFKHIIFDDNYSHGNNPKLEKERNDLVTLKQFPFNGFDYEYHEFPPILCPTETRWGDKMSEYGTHDGLFGNYQEEMPLCFLNEQKEYTWICYLNL